MLCGSHPCSRVLHSGLFYSPFRHPQSYLPSIRQYAANITAEHSKFPGVSQGNPKSSEQNGDVALSSQIRIGTSNQPEKSINDTKTQNKDLIADLEPLPDFALLGVRKSVRVALHEAFPNIRTPTACQTEFIPAILERKVVILKDRTGTGKTLGLVLALLSKPRATRPKLVYKERVALAKRPITALVVVPHRDLAYQIMQWIRILCPHNLLSSLDSIGQICVRGDELCSIETRIQKLKEQAPHILIGTPQALLEIMEKDKTVLQIPTLDTVVVDEADYLLPVPESSERKRWKNWERHPPPTLTLLNELFATRSKKSKPTNPMPWRYSLQAIFSSATFKRSLRIWLFNKTDWMDRYSQTAKIDYRMADTGEGIKHYALVVSSTGALRNSSIVEECKDPSWKNTPVKLKEESKSVTSVLSSQFLEAIATTIALDVQRIALLILPATSPVKAVIGELQDMGINVRGLGLQDEERGKAELLQSTLKKFKVGRQPRNNAEQAEVPDLLVATHTSIRGLDFPDLTHVFIAGVPGEGEEYAHAAGRVGRFGREGKVVMFLEQKDEKKAAAMYQRLDICPSEFEDIQI